MFSKVGKSNVYIFKILFIFSESVDTNMSINSFLIFFLFNISNVQAIRGFPGRLIIFLSFKRVEFFLASTNANIFFTNILGLIYFSMVVF